MNSVPEYAIITIQYKPKQYIKYTYKLYNTISYLPPIIYIIKTTFRRQEFAIPWSGNKNKNNIL